MSEGERERLKLTANFLNIVGAGTLVTGGIAPLLGSIFGTAPVDLATAVLGWAICLLLGSSLHLVGRFFLKRLDR
ncbi:hypothetical protein [Aurantimonas sp. VKM B-3413]|uniref:hypothetical protein n=1 Tax=Aurantimonas sp. VKM B-3413 TaxID=2779401 RepID=UPI001E6041B6|nr:hypothetical protein [Aurantimonas sp. VKM B-3413]MCB8837599.1 hypothetical protein [Aurantimonas sp. VKM B-3413]